MILNYSILINTTDSFEDCWMPFFTLFHKFWPDYNGKIYLNTETKTFIYPGLNIISITNNKNNPEQRITWSECLIRALNSIDNEVILYMQEDYFLKDFVKNDLVEKYVQMMVDNSEMDCIHLTDQGVRNDSKSLKYEGLFSVIPKQRYLISCQAALWKKETMLGFLRTYENAWQFEEFGSQRAAIVKPNFFGVDRSWVKLNKFEIIPYIFTGIIRGRWYEPVVDLFEKHNINVNFSSRGFVSNAPRKSLKLKLLYRWKRISFLYKNWLDLKELKRKHTESVL
jgi:hypothetical protein